MNAKQYIEKEARNLAYSLNDQSFRQREWLTGVLAAFAERMLKDVTPEFERGLAEGTRLAREAGKHCSECGEPMFITDNGIAHHGSVGEVDHDLDADHVAVDDSVDVLHTVPLGEWFDGTLDLNEWHEAQRRKEKE